MPRSNEHGTTLVPRTTGGMTHWNPWDELADVRRHMDDVFGRMYGYTPLSRLIPNEPTTFEPFVDIYETTDKVFCFVALPGFPPDAINVECTGDTITLYGERKPLFQNDKAIAYRETGVTYACSFRVSYTLPWEIDANKVKATFFNGILQLEMPKSEQARQKAVKVNIQAGR